MALTHMPAGQDNFVAGLVTVIVRGFHLTGQINSRDMGIIAHQSSNPVYHHSILVVDGGIFDRDGHIAIGQIIDAQLFQFVGHLAVVFVQHERGEILTGHKRLLLNCNWPFDQQPIL